MSDIIENIHVIIRKDHNCSACFRKIPKGKPMLYQTSIDGGDWYHDYYCETCEAFVIRNHHQYNFDEPIIDSYIEMFEAEWEQVRLEIEGD